MVPDRIWNAREQLRKSIKNLLRHSPNFIFNTIIGCKSKDPRNEIWIVEHIYLYFIP